MVREDFAAFIITHNRPGEAAETIKRIEEQTMSPSFIIVLDNSDQDHFRETLKNFENEKIEYHSMQGNKGPAYAACYGLKLLTAKGYKWIFWGDDDDPPRFPDTFETLFKIPLNLNSDEIGALGAVGHKFDWKSGRLQRIRDSELNGTIEVDSIAGNMSLIVNTFSISDKTLPNPDLFFGFEELEFSLKLQRNGFKLLVDGALMKRYRSSSGHLGIIKKRKIIPEYSEESLWRQYYSTRNLIFMMNNDFGNKKLAFRIAFVAILKSMTGFLRGTKFGRRNFYLLWLAVFDAYRKKMGMIIQPGSKIGSF